MTAENVEGEQTAETGESASESTAETNNQGSKTGGTVDTAQKQQKEGSGLSQGLKQDLFKLREAKRTLSTDLEVSRAEAADLKRRLEALEAQSKSNRSESKSAETEAGDAQSNENLDQKVEAIIAKKQAQARYESSAVDAEKWLLSRSHVKGDQKFAEELSRKILAEVKESPGSNPKSVARAAYLELCEEMGVEPDLARSESSSAFASGARHSSASGASGSKDLTDADMKAALQAGQPGSAERKAAVERVRKAVAEGRYKGNVIKA